MPRNGNGGRAKRLNASFRRWRGIHLVTGFIVGFWLVLMAVTGILVNHQEDWGLVEMDIDNRYLPAHYLDEYHPETNRLNIVINDLHSGRFLGENGRYISDGVGLLVLISVASGVYSYFLRGRLSAPVNLDATLVSPKPAARAPQTVSAQPEARDELRRGVAATKSG